MVRQDLGIGLAVRVDPRASIAEVGRDNETLRFDEVDAVDEFLAFEPPV